MLEQKYIELLLKLDFALQVLNLQCKECGKPCRSRTEQEMHKKRTGHESYEDKVSELAGLASF